MRTEKDKFIGRVTLIIATATSMVALISTFDPLWMIAIMISLVVLAIEEPR